MNADRTNESTKQSAALQFAFGPLLRSARLNELGGYPIPPADFSSEAKTWAARPVPTFLFPSAGRAAFSLRRQPRRSAPIASPSTDKWARSGRASGQKPATFLRRRRGMGAIPSGQSVACRVGSNAPNPRVRSAAYYSYTPARTLEMSPRPRVAATAKQARRIVRSLIIVCQEQAACKQPKRQAGERPVFSLRPNRRQRVTWDGFSCIETAALPPYFTFTRAANQQHPHFAGRGTFN